MVAKAEILDIARELTQTRSFQGFSFQDIADAVGIRKASLYHHFPSKDALAVALLQAYRAQFADWCRQIADAPPAEQLEGYFRLFGDLLGAGKRICPGGAFIAGWGRLADEPRDQVTQLLADHQRWLAEVIRAGTRSGALRNTGIDPTQQAAALVASVQGALLLARVQGQRQVFYDAVAPLRAALLSADNQ